MNTPSTNPNYWAEIDSIEADIKNNKSSVPIADLDVKVNEAEVDLDKPLILQPMLLSYGQDWSGAPLCVFGEGDYSCITGKSKSRKSFLRSGLIACYIGGNANKFLPYFNTHRKSNKMIIDIDTEQSTYHAQKSFLRVEQMVGGGRYPNYKAYSLRRYPPKERMSIVTRIVEKYGNDIGLISIDGYAELIDDTNDNVQSAVLSQKLMEWTDKYQFHITGVLHTNPDGGKMRGHIGSNVGRYASTVIKVEAHETDLTSRVSHAMARDENFIPFEFEINKGFPEIIKDLKF